MNKFLPAVNLSGKSTILNLIPRFYDITEGDIKIDDQSIKEKRLSSLRKNISLLLFVLLLFHSFIQNDNDIPVTITKNSKVYLKRYLFIKVIIY